MVTDSSTSDAWAFSSGASNSDSSPPPRPARAKTPQPVGKALKPKPRGRPHPYKSKSLLAPKGKRSAKGQSRAGKAGRISRMRRRNLAQKSHTCLLMDALLGINSPQLREARKTAEGHGASKRWRLGHFPFLPSRSSAGPGRFLLFFAPSVSFCMVDHILSSCVLPFVLCGQPKD
jgi:hypothetical protein